MHEGALLRVRYAYASIGLPLAAHGNPTGIHYFFYYYYFICTSNKWRKE